MEEGGKGEFKVQEAGVSDPPVGPSTVCEIG